MENLDPRHVGLSILNDFVGSPTSRCADPPSDSESDDDPADLCQREAVHKRIVDETDLLSSLHLLLEFDDVFLHRFGS